MTVPVDFLDSQTKNFLTLWRPFSRWNPHWNLPAIVQCWAADHWQGGCSQQLCQGSLHHWQGTDWNCNGQDQESLRKVSCSSRISGLPFLWRWHWVWFFLIADGKDVWWIRQEIQAHLFHLSCSRGEGTSRRSLFQSSEMAVEIMGFHLKLHHCLVKREIRQFWRQQTGVKIFPVQNVKPFVKSFCTFWPDFGW